MSPSPQNGWNIACHASAQDNCDVMKWLLDHMSKYGADVKHANKVGGAIATSTLHCHYNLQKGSSPLLIACDWQNTQMFNFLLDKSEVTQQTKVRIILTISYCCYYSG